MSLMSPGKYAAHPERLNDEKCADVYEKDNGNLILCMAFRITESGHVLKNWFTLAIAGVVNIRNVENLKGLFGWDGTDPLWFETADLSGCEVEVVVEDTQDRQDPNKYWTNIKWVNRPGASAKAYESKSGDRNALKVKYGALFRASAGPVSGQTTPTAPKSGPPGQQAGPPRKSKATVRKSNIEACWAAMQTAKNADDTEESVSEDWFAMQGETIPGKSQDDFSPEEWGLLHTRIESLGEHRRTNLR